MSELFSQPENFLAVFNSLPGAYLILSPEFILEAVTDDYLEQTLTQRANLLGHSLFEVFPDNPQAPEAQATHNLRTSLELVLATGKPHQMARQHYDVPDSKNPGHFIERHWLLRNTPIMDAQGRVQRIIHSVVNVTETVQAEQKLKQIQAEEQMAKAAATLQRLQLENILMQALALICIFEGPDHVFR